MSIYCEGAKSAEIIFSLTGGREGKLVSYAPPVSIRLSKNCFYVKKAAFVTINEVALDGQIIFEGYLDFRLTVYQDINSENSQMMINSFLNSLDNGFYFGEVFIMQSGYANDNDYKLDQFYYTTVKNKQLSLGASDWMKQGNKSQGRYIKWLEVSDSKKNMLLMQDSEGVLYAHPIPEGFTPSWQVNCIGCNPGECAGSDGKGGVVCMDCKQMNNDLQIIKKSLSM